MGLNIDPKLERRLRIAASSRGQTPEEFLSQILESSLAEESAMDARSEPDQEVVRRQRAALLELIDELDQMADEPEDGLPDDPAASVNHDKYIYRRDW